MPDLVFDGKRITVDAKTNLVEAGTAAGVPVPVFCYHKALGAVGSCRVCACTVTQGGKSKMVMACMTEAQDGMEVTTTDPESIELRKYVVEWLMVNHPHDCPICDEGGECQLQDLTIACNHSIRRTQQSKRTLKNQFLGEFISHEMNRCITCYRCSRFYQEYAGGRDFSATGSRDRMYFGRFEDGPFENPFSGNLVELCPTGVFTDKLFRYKSRVWDLEISHSICPHCSVGCNVHPGARHRELQRVRTADNEQVNGPFLCDRGQFGHGYVMDADRPTRVMVRGEEAKWDDALSTAGGSLVAIARQHGAASVAFITSPRAAVESHVALQALAAGPLDGARVCHFDDPARELRAHAALAHLAQAGVDPLEQGGIEHCDVLVIAATSLIDEAPLAALAARQVARHGGKVFVIGAPERYLNDVARVFAVHPAAVGAELDKVSAAIAAKDPAEKSWNAAVGAALAHATHPGILIGSDLADGAAMAAGERLATAVRTAGGTPRLGYLFPGPNGFGAAALSRGPALGAALAELEAGRLKAALVVESDLADLGASVVAALAKLDLLVVIDYLPGGLYEQAAVAVPSSVTYESHGIFVNRAGRAQAFAPNRLPGKSVIELIQDSSFPRTPRLAPPESGARPAWLSIETLREAALGAPEARSLSDLRMSLWRTNAAWAGIRELRPGEPGAVLVPAELKPASAEVPAFPAAGGLAIYRMDRTLGSEALSRRSEPMRRMAGPPVARVSPADAQSLGAGTVEGAGLEANGATVAIAVRADALVPQGVVIVPRDLAWPAPLSQGTRVTLRVPEGVR